MGDFKRLVAWQKAHAFELAVHAAFKGRRLAAAPGFRGQLLRAVGSIPDNLAEGCGKRSRRALAKYAEDACASRAFPRSTIAGLKCCPNTLGLMSDISCQSTAVE